MKTCKFLIGLLLSLWPMAMVSQLNHFQWKFEGQDFEVDFSYDRDEYHRIQSLPKRWIDPTARWNYPGYVLRTLEAGHLDQISDQLWELAQEEDYNFLKSCEFLLAFVQQAIRYELDEEIEGDPLYQHIRHPLETLVEGIGDCEDTALLLVAMLKSWEVDCLLFNPPRHLAVGILTPDSTGKVIEFQNRNYLFAETAVDASFSYFKIGVPGDYDLLDLSGWHVYEIPETSEPDLVFENFHKVLSCDSTLNNRFYSKEENCEVIYDIVQIRYENEDGTTGRLTKITNARKSLSKRKNR